MTLCHCDSMANNNPLLTGKMKRILLAVPFLIGSLLATEPAKEDFKRELGEDPDNRTALYNFGLASFLDEEYSEAIEARERLINLEPGDWQVRAQPVRTPRGKISPGFSISPGRARLTAARGRGSTGYPGIRRLVAASTG